MIAYALIENEQSRTFFEQLYYQYRQHMYWIARQILCDEYLAEDVTAEAFIRIAKKIDFIASLSEKQQRDYIVVILRNLAIDAYRKKRKSPEILTEAPEVSPTDDTLDEKIFGKVRYDDLVVAISKLQNPYLDVLKLRCLYQQSAEETANILGISVNSVNQRLFRAKAKLKQILKEEQYFYETE